RLKVGHPVHMPPLAMFSVPPLPVVSPTHVSVPGGLRGPAPDLVKARLFSLANGPPRVPLRVVASLGWSEESRDFEAVTPSSETMFVAVAAGLEMLAKV